MRFGTPAGRLNNGDGAPARRRWWPVDLRGSRRIPIRPAVGGGRSIDPGLLERIEDEIIRGLPSEREGRMGRARKNRDFYNFDGQQHMSEFLNDAETAADFIRRPYRESGLVRGVVDILCEHLYSPGPARRWRDGAEPDELLERIYEDNHINGLLHRADQTAAMMDAAAIQVDAGVGTYADRPITLRLWGADEFAVWPDPDDRLEPVAICTVDRYDLQTRYRLWTAEEVRTYVTDKAEGTTGGRVAELLHPPEANPYGRIPFAFVHYEQPISEFWEVGIGDMIAHAEVRINDRLSRMDQSISKHLNPIPILTNAPDNTQMILGQPNLFLRLNRRAMAPGADGAFGGGAPPDPDARYLEAHLDIIGAWEDIRSYYNMVLEVVRIPQAAWRMEQTGVASGVALLVEQAPLLARARLRQEPARIAEDALAKLVLACTGAYYRRPGLTAAAEAGHLECAWPMPSIPVQTDDWLNLQLLRLQAGLTSKILITMETYNVGRDQAIAILEQVAEDRELEATIVPEPEPLPGEEEDEAGADEDGGEDEGEGEDEGAEEDEEAEEEVAP